MDFTIITPSLNYGRFLGDCLASVAPQTGVTFEHLVIDGGSTDDSAAVAARFPHAVWTQGPDKGMSDAINKGFERARGDWVMWLNADDRLKPGALAEILKLLEKSRADVVYGDWDFIDEAGNFLRHVKAPRQVTVSDPMGEHKNVSAGQGQAARLALRGKRRFSVQRGDVGGGDVASIGMARQQYAKFFKTFPNGCNS